MAPTAPPPITKNITLAEGMTVKDLADKLEARVKDVLKKLLEQGRMMTINSTVDSETASSLAREFGADVQMRTFEQEIVDVDTTESSPDDVVPRAPVVTVMGHVDHGKTTLLDAIRETRVAEREAGGITQHIGAYHVTVGDRSIVFLDTPGHEAFTMMRSRGAKVTDVVVLVVAADDGVMPQTREAVNHAKAANVPIVVAVNKIDKPGANPDNVKRELADLGLVPEAWGGTTVMVDVSAKKRQNLDLLLEMILLSSDILELKANPKKPAMGTVLEAKLDKGRGPVATVLVQDGTLRVGDNFIAGSMVGKVRALIDDRGRPTKVAGPSTPVEVLGLTGLPQPGDTFQSIADPAKARQIALFRQEQAKTKALGAKGGRLTLESLKDAISEGGVKELPIIVKADVQGSAEVLADSLLKLSDDKVKIKIIHSGVGAISEFDVLLASASNAIVIGFNVRPDRNAADVADREKVDIRQHSVIYTVTEEIQKAMVGLLEPTFKEQRLGAAQVRELFKVPKLGTIAGCVVTEGRIIRSGDSQARLLRDNVVIFEGKISSLRRFKDDVSEVKVGHGVRHRLRQVQRPQGRRHDRGLRRREGRAGHRVDIARVHDATESRISVVSHRLESVTRQSAICNVDSMSRTIRLGEQIRQDLGDLLAREVHDPGIGFVTITRVRVTEDLLQARVFYTALGDAGRRQKTARALERAAAVSPAGARPAAAAAPRAGTDVCGRRVDRPPGARRRAARADQARGGGTGRRP